MFEAARTRITVWYVGIIMLICCAFSLVIYQVLTREFERFARVQRYRIERKISPITGMPVIDIELIKETHYRLIVALVIVNGGILVVAGWLAWGLSGRTLLPIGDMLKEQNRFVTDASHELRTPLTALKSNLEVNLRDKKLTLAEAKRILKESIDDVDRLKTLSDSLLMLTQYQKNNNGQAIEKVNVQEVVGDVVKKMSALGNGKCSATARAPDTTAFNQLLMH
jgi:signal transduction histidine kinase